MQKIPSELLSEWTSIINEVEENGYEIRRYCREQKLKEKKYYYWRRRKVTLNYGPSLFLLKQR